MGTALSTTRGTAVSTQAANPWAEASKGAGGFVGQFTKFNGKTGEYTFGTDDEEIAPGTQIFILFDLIEHGYKCWVDEKVADEEMTRIVDGPIADKRDLKDHGPYEKHDDGTEDGWQEVHSVPFVIDDNDDENAYLLQLSSMGGIKALKGLYRDYGKKFQSMLDDDGNYLIPLVELDTGSYKSKKKRVGTVHFPIFKIVDWIARGEIEDRLALIGGADDDADDEQDDAPRGRRASSKVEEEEVVEKPKDRKAVTKVEEPAEEDEAPTRGRRATTKAVEEAPKGRTQKASKVVEDEGDIEPEDHGTEEPEVAEEEDAPPARGRRNARAVEKEEPEDKPSRTAGASGGRARRFQ
jgi:hypothetical protein